MTALERAARDVDSYLTVDDDVLDFQQSGMVEVPKRQMVALRKALRETVRQTAHPCRCGEANCVRRPSDD